MKLIRHNLKVQTVKTPLFFKKQMFHTKYVGMSIWSTSTPSLTFISGSSLITASKLKFIQTLCNCHVVILHYTKKIALTKQRESFANLWSHTHFRAPWHHSHHRGGHILLPLSITWCSVQVSWKSNHWFKTSQGKNYTYLCLHTNAYVRTQTHDDIIITTFLVIYINL